MMTMTMTMTMKMMMVMMTMTMIDDNDIIPNVSPQWLPAWGSCLHDDEDEEYDDYATIDGDNDGHGLMVTTISSPMCRHGGRPHNVFFSQCFECCH